MRRKSHMAMGFLVKRMAPARQRLAGLYVSSVIIAFLAIMVWEGSGLVGITIADRSAVLDLPIGLFYLSVPVAGALMLPFALRQFADAWRSRTGWRATDEESEED
jgi:TRAP-type C4-dicarboxylate transport system permease small subunit